MKKEKVLETLDSLPDEFKTEELIEKLIFIEKVEQGLNDVEKNKESHLEEIRSRFNKKWSR
jgi:hypothetical protein